MKIYIAARFGRRPEAHALAKQLQALGHEITSRWVQPGAPQVPPSNGDSAEAAPDDRARFASEDLADLDDCTHCVSLMEEPRNNSRGGRHVEFGYAIAANKHLVIIGYRETVFHHLPHVMHFNTVDEFLAAVRALLA